MSNQGPGSPPPPGGWQPGGWQQGQTPPPPPPGYGSPQYGGPPPQYGGGYGPPAGPSTDSTAIVALVLAIASFVICPVIPAVVALFLVPSSQRKIESSRGALTGEGLLTAAKIIAWVNIGLWAVGLLIAVIVGIIAAASDDTDNLSLVLSLLT